MRRVTKRPPHNLVKVSFAFQLRTGMEKEEKGSLRALRVSVVNPFSSMPFPVSTRTRADTDRPLPDRTVARNPPKTASRAVLRPAHRFGPRFVIHIHDKSNAQKSPVTR